MRLERAVAVAVTLSLACCLQARAYRILAYEPSPGYSHWNVMSAVLESLLDGGHEVMCVTVHRATDRLAGHANYTHVNVPAETATVMRDRDLALINDLFRSSGAMIGSGVRRAHQMCAALSAMPVMRDIIDGRRAFDAIILESLFSRCSAALLASRLRTPVVYVVPSPPVNWMPAATGSPDHPSYVGTLLAGRPTPVTFAQRLRNAVDYAQTGLFRWYLDTGRWGADPDPLASAPRDAMVFVNTHHSVEPARPLGPNVVEIGGIHLREPAKPLPRHLAEVMDKSHEFGVIVFSFGSFVAMNSLPENVLNALKCVFSELPQTVIWKYEDDHMINKPSNVMIYKWLPQRDLLQHPNVKLFISHGGMSGLYEVVDAGVPVLGVPLFFDQARNIQNLIDIGMALSVDFNDMTKEKISSAVNRLLVNQSFSENAKRISSVFRDRPVTPADSVVYWTEYLIRHGTAANVKPLAAEASWISHFLVDICAAPIVAICGLWFCVRTIVRQRVPRLSSTAAAK